MTDQWWLILGLAVGTFSIRLGGYVLGAQLPSTGVWARAFAALPGCLIASLLAVILVQTSSPEWVAAGFAFMTAMLTRNLPLMMVAGIVAVWGLRVVV